MLDALGSGRQPLEQRGDGGALSVRDRGVRCRMLSTGSEALNFSAQVRLVVKPGSGDPGLAGDRVESDW
jgi:hypothetical protein